MPTVQVPAQLTVAHLMAAVKQLSPFVISRYRTDTLTMSGRSFAQLLEYHSSLHLV